MRRVLRTTSLIVLAFFGGISTATSSELIEEKVEVTNSSGKTLGFVQVLRPNQDGTYTVVDLRPKEDVYKFLNEACQEDIGPAAFYNGIEGGVTVSDKTTFGYTCHIKH